MYKLVDSKLTTTKRSIFIILLLAAAALMPAQAQAGSLVGDDVRKAISGKTLILSAMGVQLPIKYRANGVMSGSMASYVASLAGESKVRDSGKWWIKGGKLCQRWNDWLDSKTYCFTLSRQGATIHWSASNGTSGTARITN
jgi:hypothetical protein